MLGNISIYHHERTPAIAFTKWVFLVPCGPKKMIVFGGVTPCFLENFRGRIFCHSAAHDFLLLKCPPHQRGARNIQGWPLFALSAALRETDLSSYCLFKRIVCRYEGNMKTKSGEANLWFQGAVFTAREEESIPEGYKAGGKSV